MPAKRGQFHDPAVPHLGDFGANDKDAPFQINIAPPHLPRLSGTEPGKQAKNNLRENIVTINRQGHEPSNMIVRDDIRHFLFHRYFLHPLGRVVVAPPHSHRI